MSGGFFRGTSADQDTRFSIKQAKLLKSQKFPPELDHLVDMTKVKMDVIRPWIATRATELLGFEDEVLINFVYDLLDVKVVDGKKIQVQLTGFMEKNTSKFMKELWTLLLSAQNNVSGVPQQFLDAKEEEQRKKKEENDKISQEIQKRKERAGRELEREKNARMEDEDVSPKSHKTGTEMLSRPKDSSDQADEMTVDVNYSHKIRNGFRSSEEHSSSSIDLKKKRKLQNDLGILDMPSPKQRLRIGPNIFEEPIIRETQNDLEQLEERSENDSNSFVTTMASDVKGADENSITLTIHQEQPSTSLNNSSNRVNKGSLYSLESRGFKEVSDATTADLEEILQLDLGNKVAEEMYSSFESVHAILEFESEGDTETESLVLYSNDVAPHSFLRSSGCWNLGQDAPLGTKKPTIDQEFEQYFSSLML